MEASRVGEKPFLAVVDVGHGNCAVVVCEDDVVVVDAGPRTGLLEFLRQQGISRVGLFILSHADEDHIAGLLSLIESRTVGVMHVCVNADSSKTSQVWDDLAWELGNFQPQVGLSTKTPPFRVGGVDLTIVSPSPYLAMKAVGGKDRRGREIQSNSISAAVRISVDGKPSVLLAGDLDHIALDSMRDAGVDASAPILVFPHHGGLPGNADPKRFTTGLMDLASPRAVVFSVGRRRAGFPHPEVVGAVRAYSSDTQVFCTQVPTACHPDDTPNRGRKDVLMHSQGETFGACCAGTIVIQLDGSFNVTPCATDHAAFVASLGGCALCRQP